MKLRELITGDDNQTLEIHFVMGAAAFVIGLALEVYCVISGKSFDLQGYGGGVALLIAGMGLGRKLGGGEG